jgi:hypothetical protein
MGVLMKMIFVIILLSFQANASENWFCSTQASRVENNTILACGVAVEKSEDKARIAALENATKEYMALCSKTDGCLNHEVTAEPGRTECSKVKDEYTCHRLISFVIKNTTLKTAKEEKPLNTKLRIGMTKEEMLKRLGPPKDILQRKIIGGKPYSQVFYQNEYCENARWGDHCYLIIQDGVVTEIRKFLMENLDTASMF